MRDPAVMLLLRNPRWQLEYMARERGLPGDGTKKVLAEGIAKVDNKRFTKAWRAIADGGSG